MSCVQQQQPQRQRQQQQRLAAHATPKALSGRAVHDHALHTHVVHTHTQHAHAAHARSTRTYGAGLPTLPTNLPLSGRAAHDHALDAVRDLVLDQLIVHAQVELAVGKVRRLDGGDELRTQTAHGMCACVHRSCIVTAGSGCKLSS
jgi:hypothetical protein